MGRERKFGRENAIKNKSLSWYYNFHKMYTKIHKSLYNLHSYQNQPIHCKSFPLHFNDLSTKWFDSHPLGTSLRKKEKRKINFLYVIS